MFDALERFSTDQDLSQDAGNYLSDKSFDTWGGNTARPTTILGNTPVHDIGRGMPPELVVELSETVTSGGAATIEFQLVQADDEALSSNLEVLQSTGAIALADLVAGYQARLAIPPGIDKRFIGVRYVIATATTTAGKANAYLARVRPTAPGIFK